MNMSQGWLVPPQRRPCLHELELDNLRVLKLYVSFKEEDFTRVLELPILGWPVPLKVLNLGLTPAPPDCVPDFFFDQYLADTGHLLVGPMYSNIRYAFTNMHDMHQCVLHAQQGWQRFTARHRGTIEAPGRSLWASDFSIGNVTSRRSCRIPKWWSDQTC